MINEHWSRWIFASISKHFNDRKNDLVLYIEGQNVPPSGDIIDLRTNGPTWTQAGNKIWDGLVTINMLVRAMKDESDTHKIYRMVGKVEFMFQSCIPVLKLGKTPAVDTEEQIGVLQQVEDITTTHFGQVTPTVPAIQSTVEGNYRVTLEN